MNHLLWLSLLLHLIIKLYAENNAPILTTGMHQPTDDKISIARTLMAVQCYAETVNSVTTLLSFMCEMHIQQPLTKHPTNEYNRTKGLRFITHL